MEIQKSRTRNDTKRHNIIFNGIWIAARHSDLPVRLFLSCCNPPFLFHAAKNTDTDAPTPIGTRCMRICGIINENQKKDVKSREERVYHSGMFGKKD